MGDLMMNRKPSPSVLLALKELINYISISETKIVILRGNHDSETKADDGVTALSLFDNKARVVVHTEIDHKNKRVYIPHYENQEIIKRYLSEVPEGYTVFGHFGYNGCLNSAGDCDFNINFAEFISPSFLGHIHRFNKRTREAKGSLENVTILGTPYTTNYGESGKENFYGILDDGGPRNKKNTGWISSDAETYITEFKPIEHGPRHLVVSYKDLLNPDVVQFINDKSYYTMLRVFRDRDDEEINFEGVDVEHLEIKWHPSTDNIVDNLDAYSPDRDLFSVNEVILEDYIASVDTDLTRDQIMEGYSLIKNED